MKYDLDLEVPPPGTSHAVVLDLVGGDKRVLDVGCSTGYLARLMASRGNTVSGVEIDPEAAAIAAPFLARVEVGDLSSLDLCAAFPEASFDVLVFADVLEHLVDPIDVLRRAIPLLAPGGSVVISLPNVSHASVRLTLLEGKFDYRPLGLLDDTHVRFFTRSTVEGLLRAAGLVPVDMRRTVADAMATEVTVELEHFPPSIIDEVRRLPDADTYQFVLRAIPSDAGAGSGASAALATALVDQAGELSALRRNVREILDAADGHLGAPAIALSLGAAPDEASPFAGLRAAVVSAELRSRLPRVALDLYRSGPGATTTWQGAPVARWPEPADDAEVAALAEILDAIVVVGADLDGPPLGALGIPVRCAGLVRSPRLPSGAGFVRDSPGSGPGILSPAPDPLVAAGRLVEASHLTLHIDQMQARRRIPPLDGHLLLVVDGRGDPGADDALGRAVAEVAASCGVAVVVTSDPSHDPGHRRSRGVAGAVPGAHLVDDPDELDLLALAGTASLLVSDSADALALALSLERPVAALGWGAPGGGLGGGEVDALARWVGDPDLVAATPAALLAAVPLARRRAQDPDVLRRLHDPLDLALDDLGVALTGDGAAGLAPSMPALLRSLTSRILLLEESQAALQRRLVSERAAFGHRLRAGREDVATRSAVAVAERRAVAAEEDARAARAELAAHNETLTMRALAPSRRIYGRIRGLR